VHVLLIGALLFTLYGVLHRTAGAAPDQVVISAGQLASMREIFIRTRQRPPTSIEWDGMIRDRVREEVYYREALALGLDKDDAIIRRRLQQKMQFISADAVSEQEPTDGELQAYLLAHPEKFRVQPEYTFRQVYLDPSKHGSHLARDAGRLLGRLNRAGHDGSPAAQAGDPLPMPRSFVGVPASDVARQFGDTFAVTLGALALGRWEGPVSSAYGSHLVLLIERSAGGAATLTDVRDAVRREWEAARGDDANQKFYQELLQRYTVTVEDREPTADGYAAGGAR
jgi:hypothetical protein